MIDLMMKRAEAQTTASPARFVFDSMDTLAFLQRIGPAAVLALKQRVAAELKTTFASHYSKQVSLAGALQASAIAEYGARATGAKYLINPQAGLTA